MPIEELIVRYAAPTLAGCKVANLINLPISICTDENLDYCRQCLASKGIAIEVLLEKENRRLVYVYRCSALQDILDQKDVQTFLSLYGYKEFSNSSSLDYLTEHFSAMDLFPHEIGVFLGYPLADVKGFLFHRGKNAKLSGYWKVYDNEEEAKKTFALYNSCRQSLCAQYHEGISLADLSVVG